MCFILDRDHSMQSIGQTRERANTVGPKLKSERQLLNAMLPSQTPRWSTQRKAVTNDNTVASSIPSNDSLAKDSLLSHKRNSSTDDAIAANTQV